MSDGSNDRAFGAVIARLYESSLVPLLFAPYADDLVRRLAGRRLTTVLEIAAGTGVVTRRMAAALPTSVAIVATDLNQAMLDRAAEAGVSRPVEWRQADAMHLPFADDAFDAVVCQFGVMFFPDRVQALSEMRRVLRPGGVLIFSVWDRLEENEFAEAVSTAVAAVFPDDPPRFLSRTPYAYHDAARIAGDLAASGFPGAPDIETVAACSRAASSREVAVAFCQGTPLRTELEARDASRLGEATDAAAEAIDLRCGRGAAVGKMQAHVVTITR